MKQALVVLLGLVFCVGCAPTASNTQVETHALETTGVHVLTVNQQTLVVIPSPLLFSGPNPLQTPPTQISASGYPIVAELAQLIKDSSPRVVEIFVYTGSDLGGAQRAADITQVRASHLAAYLWSQGIEPAVMVYRGMGQMGPIASNDKSLGLAQNNRVEVRWFD